MVVCLKVFILPSGRNKASGAVANIPGAESMRLARGRVYAHRSAEIFSRRVKIL